MTTWKEWSAWWRGIFHFHMQLSRFMPLEDAMRKIPPSIWREILRRIFFFPPAANRADWSTLDLVSHFNSHLSQIPNLLRERFYAICLFAGLWVFGTERERERERVDPRRKLLIALVVLNCLQPLPKLSGEINIEKHYKIIFKKIQQHIWW